jgi:heme exporter protein CcmD
MNELYIWGSYVVTFLCMAIEVALLVKRTREAKA